MAPRIGYVYPAGGQQGCTFTVTAGGVLLDAAYEAVISGEGITTKVIERSRPMSQASSLLLVDRMKVFQEKRKTARATKTQMDPADLTAMENLREMISSFPPLNRTNPSLSEFVTLEVTIAPDAPTGERELRLRTTAGLTNPRLFHVGSLPEWSKPLAKTKKRFEKEDRDKKTSPEEFAVSLPIVVNGQTMPGGVDRFRFSATKGTHLVIAASARQLIPYLPDAVPGWFQALLTLYDASGKELSYSDHFFFHPDPVLQYEIPKDGEYIAEIRDSIYRGREDFVYRISMGALPVITGIFPLGGPAAAKNKIEIHGWNLPSPSITRDDSQATPGLYPIVIAKDRAISNSVPFSISTDQEILEKGPNNTPQTAQLIRFPSTVNGRITTSGKQDFFKFKAPPGTPIIAEIFARRLESPLDSFLKITDTRDTLIASNDDHEDKSQGLDTHHADSRIETTLTEGGTYLIAVSDTQQQAGPEYAYRLQIKTPQPDFELRATPSSLTVKGTSPAALTVFALRKNGFKGPIKLALADAPQNFKLSKNEIPADADKLELSLTIPLGLLDAPISLAIEGIAEIGGQRVVRRAMPAEDMMQAFAYRHLVPSQRLYVDTAGKLPVPYNPKLLSYSPASLPVGQSTSIRLAIPGYISKRLLFELVAPPPGISLGNIKPGPETEIEILADSALTTIGQKGELTLKMLQKPLPPRKQKDNLPSAPSPVEGTVPPILYEIVSPQKTPEP